MGPDVPREMIKMVSFYNPKSLFQPYSLVGEGICSISRSHYQVSQIWLWYTSNGFKQTLEAENQDHQPWISSFPWPPYLSTFQPSELRHTKRLRPLPSSTNVPSSWASPRTPTLARPSARSFRTSLTWEGDHRGSFEHYSKMDMTNGHRFHVGHRANYEIL